MSKGVRLFEKDEFGLLVQVDPDIAEQVKENRQFSRVQLEIDVLLTPAELAQRDLEIKQAADDASRQSRIEKTREEDKASALQKLKDVGGLTDDEISALVR